MTDPRKRIVAAGYDRIAERYRAWSGTALGGRRAWAVGVLTERLPPGAAVLDLGCATGIPVARALAERFAVTGVDLSPRQVALARRNAPGGTFLLADMAALELSEGAFAGVIACYALTHLPREELPTLFAKIARWLRPGGLLVASLGAGDDPGTVEPDWLGAPMFFSGYPSETGKRHVEAAGLRILVAEEVTEDEDGVPVTFLWVAAEKPADRATPRGAARARRPAADGETESPGARAPTAVCIVVGRPFARGFNPGLRHAQGAPGPSRAEHGGQPHRTPL